MKIILNIIFILILVIIRGFNGPDATSADIIVLTPVIESKEATLMDLISLDMLKGLKGDNWWDATFIIIFFTFATFVFGDKVLDSCRKRRLAKQKLRWLTQEKRHKRVSNAAESIRGGNQGGQKVSGK